ncbi:alpha/beta hydrolase [Kribbella antibiotica]|uniref:Alpha/beta hydrolase n=1 Tax=Kribbella antibiotica TaxID=190195 RepID=A0A4R4YMJ2_9ACTN|nr:alpha/beta hydrolase [Kribbella antibiotica]TDD45720.1 alpha/beta hydrolase [Kribbella antibiotica]
MGDGVRLTDGRWIELWDGGARAGTPVLFLAGCPDTRHAAYPGDEAARRLGIRLVAINRPGYGRSTSHPSTHASVADDVVAVADALGIERFAVMGMSIGGPYTAASAALHPERVTALAVLASPASVPELDPPYHRDDLDADRQAFFDRLARTSPAEAAELMRPDFLAYVAQLNPADPDDTALVRRFLAELDPHDAKVLRGATGAVAGLKLGSDQAIAAGIREALVNPDGYLRDAAISFRTWEFQPEAVRCPTHLWYGELDANASVRNGHWLAERIPPATLVIHPQTTHLAVLQEHWVTVLSGLAESGS